MCKNDSRVNFRIFKLATSSAAAVSVRTEKQKQKNLKDKVTYLLLVCC